MTSRALGVLDAFDLDHPRLGLSDVARRSGTPVSTAHRLLIELVAWGALARRPDGRYEIGRKLWDLGLLAPVQLELRRVAAPFLLDVHTATRDTVQLAVRDGLQALYVELITSRASVSAVSCVGTRLPLHATGVGKALLAAAPDAVVQDMTGRLTRQTPRTVVDAALLTRQLREARGRGWVRTSQEMTRGAASVAVPVTAQRAGQPIVVAALGVVVPADRRDVSRLVPTLQVAARGIGRALSHVAEWR